MRSGLLAGGPVRIEGVGADSVQGDVAFAQLARAMGGQVKAGVALCYAAALGLWGGALWAARPDPLVFVALGAPAHEGPAPETLAPSATGVTTLRCGTLIDGRSASVKKPAPLLAPVA